jgi:hypothetical protein
MQMGPNTHGCSNREYLDGRSYTDSYQRMSGFIIWDEGPVERLTDADQIVRRLQDIAADRRVSVGVPYGLDLLRDNGACLDDPTLVERLSIGVGNGDWLLGYYAGDGTFLNALGDENASGIVTFNFGEWTEFSRKYLIPKEAALTAIRAWIQTGELTDAVRWTAELY